MGGRKRIKGGWLHSRRHIGVTPCVFHMPGIKRGLQGFNHTSKWQIAKVLPCEWCRRFAPLKCDFLLSFFHLFMKWTIFLPENISRHIKCSSGWKGFVWGGVGDWNNETIDFFFYLWRKRWRPKWQSQVLLFSSSFLGNPFSSVSWEHLHLFHSNYIRKMWGDRIRLLPDSWTLWRGTRLTRQNTIVELTWFVFRWTCNNTV